MHYRCARDLAAQSQFLFRERLDLMEALFSTTPWHKPSLYPEVNNRFCALPVSLPREHIPRLSGFAQQERTRVSRKLHAVHNSRTTVL